MFETPSGIYETNVKNDEAFIEFFIKHKNKEYESIKEISDSENKESDNNDDDETVKLSIEYKVLKDIRSGKWNTLILPDESVCIIHEDILSDMINLYDCKNTIESIKENLNPISQEETIEIVKKLNKIKSKFEKSNSFLGSLDNNEEYTVKSFYMKFNPYPYKKELMNNFSYKDRNKIKENIQCPYGYNKILKLEDNSFLYDMFDVTKTKIYRSIIGDIVMIILEETYEDNSKNIFDLMFNLEKS